MQNIYHIERDAFDRGKIFTRRVLTKIFSFSEVATYKHARDICCVWKILSHNLGTRNFEVYVPLRGQLQTYRESGTYTRYHLTVRWNFTGDGISARLIRSAGSFRSERKIFTETPVTQIAPLVMDYLDVDAIISITVCICSFSENS